MILFDMETSFEKMPDGEPFICSFSGGKDSTIALSMACERGECKGIIHWFDEEKNKSVFHAQDQEIIESQSKCMELPLIISNYTPWSHRLELIEEYKELARQGVKSIIFGDIYIEDSVKLQQIICKKAGIVPRFPLWKKNYEFLFCEFQKRNIKTIISRVNICFLDDKWLGKEYNQETFEQFEKLGIDQFGEKGEFHTTVVDADIFKKPLSYRLSDVSKDGNDVKIGLSSHELQDNVYQLLKY